MQQVEKDTLKILICLSPNLHLLRHGCGQSTVYRGTPYQNNPLITHILALINSCHSFKWGTSPPPFLKPITPFASSPHFKD